MDPVPESKVCSHILVDAEICKTYSQLMQKYAKHQSTLPIQNIYKISQVSVSKLIKEINLKK